MILLSIVIVICSLVIAMVLEEKRQTRKRKERIRIWFKKRQRGLRLWKWSERGLTWRRERKKPVKVQFD